MATSGGLKIPKSDKLDEAQALAKRCAGRPDFLPCDGLSICATHSHGKCFKLHWCCHLGWCHCKYVYQPMTSVCQLPSTLVPADPSHHTGTMELSSSLVKRFLQTAPCFRPPLYAEPPRYCIIADLFVDDYVVRRVNGKMCYVQRAPLAPTPADPPPPQPDQAAPEERTAQGGEASRPKMDHCSSPSTSEDSGINALGLPYLGSGDEVSEDEDEEEEGQEEDDVLSTDGDSSPSSLWDQNDSALLSPSKSTVEIIENIETTV